MKKVALAVIAAIVAVTFALPAFAEDAKSEKPKKREFTGVITAVDAAAKTVSVMNKEGETRTFHAGAAKISAGDNNAAELGALKVGDKVHTVFTEEGGKLVARKIGPPEAKKEKEKEKKEEKKS